MAFVLDPEILETLADIPLPPVPVSSNIIDGGTYP